MTLANRKQTFLKAATFLLVAVLGAAQASTSKISRPSDIPQFNDYAILNPHKAQNAAPVLDDADKKNYRTRIREAARGKPDFAGRYTLATWGCGTGCNTGAIINLVTGRVFMLPFSLASGNTCGQEGKPGLSGPNFEYHLDSALIILDGKFEYQEGKWQDPSEGKSGHHYFFFDGNALRYLRTIEYGPCPTQADATSGDASSEEVRKAKPGTLPGACPLEKAVYVADNAPEKFEPDTLRFSFERNPDAEYPSQHWSRDEIEHIIIHSDEMDATIRFNISFQNGTGIRSTWASVPPSKFSDRMKEHSRDTVYQEEGIEFESDIWVVNEAFEAYDVPTKRGGAPVLVLFPGLRPWLHSSNQGIVSVGIGWGVFRFSHCEETSSSSRSDAESPSSSETDGEDPSASPSNLGNAELQLGADGSVSGRDFVNGWRSVLGKRATVEYCTVYDVSPTRANCAVFDAASRVGDIVLPTDTMNSDSLKWALAACKEPNPNRSCTVRATGTVHEFEGRPSLSQAVLLP